MIRNITFTSALRILRWEWAGISIMPVSWLFAAIFVALSNAFIFLIGGWLDQNQADLEVFFSYVPWFFMVLIPALVMNQWPDDKRTARTELLRNQPVPQRFHILARYLANLAFLLVLLLISMTLWVTASYLGDPDHGLILSGYLGIFLIIALYCAIAQAVSTYTTSPLVAFIVSLAINFLLSFSATSILQDAFRAWSGEWILGLFNILSPYAHYVRFTQGDVSLSSIIYFIVFIILFLELASWRIFNGARQRLYPAFLGLGFVGILAILIVVPSPRWDLSFDDRHTLPEGLATYVKDYPGEVTISLYYSKELGHAAPAFAGLYKRLHQRMQEYKVLNPEKISLQVNHVTAYSEEEENAIAAGLNGVHYDNTGQLAYFGLEIKVDELSGVTPFVDLNMEPLLDYELLTKLNDLKPRDSTPKIGIISSLPLDASPQADAPIIIEELRNRYDVVTIRSAEQLAGEWPDLLLIVQPSSLGQNFLFAIEQFLLQKGKAIMLLDPVNETAASGGFGPPNPAMIEGTTPLKPLLSHWGLSIDSDSVVIDAAQAELVSIPVENGQYRTVSLPSWIKVDNRLIDLSEPALQDVVTMLLPSPGHIEGTPSEPLDLSVLVMTSPTGGLVPQEAVQTPLDLEAMLKAPEHPMSYPIAARLSGTFTASQNPESQESRQEVPAESNLAAFYTLTDQAITESEKELEVYLVAESDFLFDRFWVQTTDLFGTEQWHPSHGNGFFILSAVESLLQEVPLQGLRARHLVTRPFTKLEQLRQQAAISLKLEEEQLLTTIKELREKAIQSRSEGKDTSLGQDDATRELVEGLRHARESLRKVQGQLNTQINLMTNVIKILHILVIPLGIFLLGPGLAWWNTRRQVHFVHRHLS